MIKEVFPVSNRDLAKMQIDVLPDSAVDRVIEFISYQLFIIGQEKVSTDIENKARAKTWAELDTIIESMDELPAFEDFAKADFGRDVINFCEVQ